MKKLVIVLFIVILALSAMLTIQTRSITQLNRKAIADQNTIDSLHDELFINHIMNDRYELTLDHLNKVNPKAALEFINFMNHETE
jgi:cell division protein FtsL